MAVFITEIVFISTSKCTVVYCNLIFMCLGTDSTSTQRRIGPCAKLFSPHFSRCGFSSRYVSTVVFSSMYGGDDVISVFSVQVPRIVSEQQG